MKTSPKNFLNSLVAILLLLPGALSVHADTALHQDEANLHKGSDFALGIGFGIVKFDTNVKVTDKVIGGTRYLDLEGNLDLQKNHMLQHCMVPIRLMSTIKSYSATSPSIVLPH